MRDLHEPREVRELLDAQFDALFEKAQPIEGFLREATQVEKLQIAEHLAERSRTEQLKEPEGLEQARLAGFLLAIAARLLAPSDCARYLEEFRAELLDVPDDTRLSHALSLLRGILVLRLRRGLKDKAADAAARRVKG
ncbi:MAG TPA: hypothetical protein VFW64_02560 [Pseudonocardiaceae bacterium]|nr:hypothetical protein [Pseudonocardiaceae bacterium]